MTRTNEVRVYVAKKGSGKTTLVRRALVTFPRRLIVDPMREYREGVVVEGFDALAAYLERMRVAPRYSVVLRTMDDDERDAVLDLVTAGSPEDPPLPGVLIVLDEVDRICTPYDIKPGLKRLVNYGRHYGASLFAVSRRPRAMHRDITANADRIIVGQTQEPGDVEYLREFTGPEFAARAMKLRQYEFLTYPDDLNREGDASTVGKTPPVVDRPANEAGVSGASRGGDGPGADAREHDGAAAPPTPTSPRDDQAEPAEGG